MTEKVWIELIQNVTALIALLAFIAVGVYIYRYEKGGGK